MLKAALREVTGRAASRRPDPTTHQVGSSATWADLTAVSDDRVVPEPSPVTHLSTADGR